jgi:phage baseplate assembly protein gpV
MDIPRYSYGLVPGAGWHLRNRVWSASQIDEVRPPLAPIKPSLFGTLQRHGLAVQNENTGGERTWSPTELGEQVFLRFRDAGTELPDVWSSGPAGQQ